MEIPVIDQSEPVTIDVVREPVCVTCGKARCYCDDEYRLHHEISEARDERAY